MPPILNLGYGKARLNVSQPGESVFPVDSAVAGIKSAQQPIEKNPQSPNDKEQAAIPNSEKRIMS
jgi:hypothetical protein